MRQKRDDEREVEKGIRVIQRRTRRKFSREEKIRIVLQGLRGEDRIAELCRREGLQQNQDYRWSKEFLEAGRNRLAGDIERGGVRAFKKAEQIKYPILTAGGEFA